MEELNPYAAPKAEALTRISEAETIRRQHIGQESSIKTLGCLYLLGGVLILPGIALSLVQSNGRGGTSGDLLWHMVFISVALAAIVIGFGLRTLKKWASILAITLGVFLCVIYLFDLPSSTMGLIIQTVVILTLVSAKTRKVVSADYQQVIAETPHVRPRTSVAAWVLLGVLLLALAWVVYQVVITR
jgi:hypothetical protein